jgi:putative toxin-antitoxin system antitoxin component (TIGR02293 family)
MAKYHAPNDKRRFLMKPKDAAKEPQAGYCTTPLPQGSSIGIEACTLEELIGRIKEGFPVNALERLRDRIGVSDAVLSEVLRIPPRTLNRRKKAGTLDPAESERVYRLARVFERALDLFGDEDKARRWLKTPNRAFGGKTPLAFADTEIGAREVEDLVGRLEHGVYV